MKNIVYKPIGLIHSPFNDIQGMPIQTTGASGIQGTIEIYPEYVDGLKDLEGFSHIILLYHFHRSTGFSLIIKPFLDDAQHGVFATRAPRRPNPIGFSVVKLIKAEGSILTIEGVDIMDSTPLLDIKPYTHFDVKKIERIGWLDKKVDKALHIKSDGRFGS